MCAKNISWVAYKANFPYFKHDKLANIQYLVKLADQVVTDFLPEIN